MVAIHFELVNILPDPKGVSISAILPKILTYLLGVTDVIKIG
jgi:hypothetical protein